MGEPWWVPSEVLLMVAAAGGLVWTWWRDGESRELYWSAGLHGCRDSGWRPVLGGSFLKPTDLYFSGTTDFDLQLDGEATIELFTDCWVFLEGAPDYKPPEYCKRVHIQQAPLQSDSSAVQNIDYRWICLSEILGKAEFMEELKMLNTFVEYSQELNQNPLSFISFCSFCCLQNILV